MVKNILVFKKDSKGAVSSADIDLSYNLRVWKPSLLNFLPPNKGYKYFMYWLFYMFGIFKNTNYSAYLLYDKGELVSSLLVIPSYFKWPFMGKTDIQFAYVMTSRNYRGKGVAGKLIKQAMADFNQKVGAFWYVTDTENDASIRVAEKLGFRCYGKAERDNLLKILKLNTINE